MEPLSYEGLSFEDKMYLGGLEKHPGFPVLKKLMEDACLQATAKAISTDPEDPAYDTKLKARQLIARVTNDVCATLLKSIVMHSEAGKIEDQIRRIQAVAEEVNGVEEPSPVFGSMRVKKKSPPQEEVV